jgi:hypothetical protein
MHGFTRSTDLPRHLNTVKLKQRIKNVRSLLDHIHLEVRFEKRGHTCSVREKVVRWRRCSSCQRVAVAQNKLWSIVMA